MNKKLRIGLRIFAWLFVLTWAIYGLTYANKVYKGQRCTKLEVRVLDSARLKFVKAKDVYNTIVKSKNSPLGMPLSRINTHKIEQEICQMAAVRDVQAFKTAKGTLKVEITQRQPVLRVFNAKGQTYYIDDSGKILPYSSGFAANTLVANGNILEPFKVVPNLDVTAITDSTKKEPKNFIHKLYEFAMYVNNDKFWNAQIVQVYVRNHNNIELIPLVSPHIIALGSLDNFEVKLKKLRLFYEKAMPAEGWNKYAVINLKFKNQIVCTKY
ncbi:MAG TPA: cell division protein FtsQ [Bacteroidales bacterium]|nr:cell division protein FtsQ [Bacteroidales bacterium]